MPWLRLWSSSDDEEANKNNNKKPVEQIRQIFDQGAGADAQPSDKLSQKSSVFETFTQPQTIIATVALTFVTLQVFGFYRSYLKRIPEAINIPSSFLRKRSVFGRVTSVGDGDNFRLYHTPGGVLAGWGWLPGRKVPTDKKALRNQTIHVRLAGIDAPELAHFGRPAQPFSQDSLEWLTKYILGRRVRAEVYKQDQYQRVVATVYVRKGLFRRDVGLQMLRAGLATVYEAKTGVEFGKGLASTYHDAEAQAKSKKKGMWIADSATYESPREYKSKHGSGRPAENANG